MSEFLRKINAMRDAIEAAFSDMSVPPATTLSYLRELQEEIAIRIESLQEQIDVDEAEEL